MVLVPELCKDLSPHEAVPVIEAPRRLELRFVAAARGERLDRQQPRTRFVTETFCRIDEMASGAATVIFGSRRNQRDLDGARRVRLQGHQRGHDIGFDIGEHRQVFDRRGARYDNLRF